MSYNLFLFNVYMCLFDETASINNFKISNDKR